MSIRRGTTAALVAGMLTGLAIAGGVGADAATSGARVIRWVDGDTVATDRGTIRLIGVDTPERGQCGYGAATRHAQAVASAGSRIRLGNPSSVLDRDAYGRKLRYVLTIAGRDLGLAQIKGNASSMIYHQPGQQYYDVTVAEECFATPSQAEAAGYRAAKV